MVKSALLQATGKDSPYVLVLPPPVKANRAPRPSDIMPLGQFFVDDSVSPYNIWISLGNGTFEEIGNSSSSVLSITGTANQILATPATGSVVLSLIGPFSPSTFTAHSVLLGEGTSAIGMTAVGTTGQVLTGVTGADPIWASPATSGTVTSVTGTANQVAVATGTTTPVISLIGPYTPATYTAHGVLVGEGTSSIVALAAGTNGEILIGSTGADPVFGHLTPGNGVIVTEGAGTVSLGVVSGGFGIVPVAGTTQAMLAQTAYIANNAGQTTFTLPATATVGDTILIVGSAANTGGWIVAQKCFAIY